jgi:hypothetical protein
MARAAAGVLVAVAALTVLGAARAEASAPTLGLGDSVMLGSVSLLHAHGVRVDAKVSRQFSMAPALVRAYRRAASLPPNVVVHLGTNGTVSGADCRAVVDASGPARRVFLVTIHARRVWTTHANRSIRACAAHYGTSRVVVLDWATLAAAHPGWFWSDGIHPNSTGQRSYAAIITSAIARYGV